MTASRRAHPSARATPAEGSGASPLQRLARADRPPYAPGVADEDAQLLTLLGQSFPSLKGSDGSTRVESLGLFAANAWAAGPAGMAQRGVPLAGTVHQSCAAAAAKVAAARSGGLRFLHTARRAFGQDEAFLGFVRQLAQVYAAAASSGRIPAPRPPSGESSPGASRVEVAGFEVFDLIGQGTMGRVFKARQKSLDRMVALKVLNRSLAEEDPTYVERFQQEARAAARLQHPHIVAVIDQGTCPRTGAQYIAFELIDGETARELLTKQGNRLEEREALAIALAVAEALSCAEEHQIVHRDVKPDNILVGADGIPKLADLGLAKRQRDQRKDLTDPNLVVGTPHFMAPEQALGVEAVDGRADLYALGVCLFHFVTGAYPFDGDNSLQVLTRKLNEEVPDPRTVDPRVSPAVAQLVGWLSARERDRRYRGARAAAEDLERVLAGMSPLGPLQAGNQPRASRTGRIRLGTASGAWPAPGRGLADAVAPVELTPPTDLDQPTQAIWRFRHTGQPEALDAAEALFQMKADRGDAEKAARGQAGLALIQGLRGDRAASEREVLAALERDPGCRQAFLVRLQLEAGLADQAPFRRALARLSSLVAVGRHEDAAAVAGELRREFPSEPHPHLLLLASRKAIGDEGGFREALQLAWALYPSRERAAVPLGGGLDLKVAELLVEHGCAGLVAGDAARMLQAVEGAQERSNLVAGSLSLGIAVIHTRLADPELEPPEVAPLLLLLARGLEGLQHFKHAREVLDRVAGFLPTPPGIQSGASGPGKEGEEALRLAEEERRRIAGWEAVPHPGIKPQRGRFACPVGKALVDGLQERVHDLSRRQREAERELQELAARAAERALADAAVKAAIRSAAQAAGRSEDPFAELDGLARELEGVDAELKTLGEGKPEGSSGGGGFLARLKGAADVAGRVAKQGQLKLKETQLKARQAGSQRRLGQLVVSELCRQTFADAWIQGVARKALRLTSEAAAMLEEERRAREGLRRLGAA